MITTTNIYVYSLSYKKKIETLQPLFFMFIYLDLTIPLWVTSHTHALPCVRFILYI